MKINFVKTLSVALCALLLFTGCQSWNNMAKGGVIGAAGGAALGALVGKLTGNTAVGAAVGTAVGTGAGLLIGKKMDKAAEAAAKVDNATVETVTDANNLTAVKVTFDSGLMFDTNKYALKANAKANLKEFAAVLNEFNDADVAIFGHTDSTGSDAINDPLSVNRANAEFHATDIELSRGVCQSRRADFDYHAHSNRSPLVVVSVMDLVDLERDLVESLDRRGGERFQ